LSASPIWAKLPAPMADPTLYGAAYSVYTRIARLALLEKGVAFHFEIVDIFAEGAAKAQLPRHPFGLIPAFAHDDFALYETAAICRYIDEGFPGPPLQPATPRERARMAQLIGLLDSYAYRAMVWDVFVESVRKPIRGEAVDAAKVKAGLAKAETCLAALAELMGQAPFLAGDAMTLADLHAAPMIAYFGAASAGAAALARHPSLSAWWEGMRARASLLATPSPLIDHGGTN
jgi:glutathione S-transferase